MGEEVRLSYKRVDVDRCTGDVTYKNESHGQAMVGCLVQFESIEFKPMLQHFAEALQKYPAASAVWNRTDRSGLLPYILEQRLTDLFRTDPVAAISSLCPPQRSPSTTIQRIKEAKAEYVPVAVRACFDTLADAFGDDLYSRTRMRKDVLYTECPGCGLWMPVWRRSPALLICNSTKCAVLSRELHVAIANEKWAGFKTSHLLALPSPRYYFPRAWNDGRPWVSREKLTAMFTEYEKEKQLCRTQSTT